MAKSPSPERVRAARTIAILADAAQIAAFPLFFNPILEPLNIAFDTVMAVVFISLVGWHWALLPAFLSEAIPFWDLVPTWTAAVFLATRGSGAPSVATTVPDVTIVPPPALPASSEEEKP